VPRSLRLGLSFDVATGSASSPHAAEDRLAETDTDSSGHQRLAPVVSLEGWRRFSDFIPQSAARTSTPSATRSPFLSVGSTTMSLRPQAARGNAPERPVKPPTPAGMGFL
jgi:hypothetical protein